MSVAQQPRISSHLANLARRLLALVSRILVVGSDSHKYLGRVHAEERKNILLFYLAGQGCFCSRTHTHTHRESCIRYQRYCSVDIMLAARAEKISLNEIHRERYINIAFFKMYGFKAMLSILNRKKALKYPKGTSQLFSSFVRIVY